MNRSTLLAALLCAAFMVPHQALAQDENPPTIMMSAWMCNQASMGDLVDDFETRQLPIAQELVDEGMMQSAMLMVHHWGDEWNYVTVMMADDMESGAAAFGELNSRYADRYGDDGLDFLAHCTTHRDAIHTGAWTTDGDDEMPELPMSVALSAFACPFNALGDILEQHREIMLPAAQASVDAGMGDFVGASTHAWGDEWNYVIWRGAADIPALMAFNDDTNERADALAGEDEENAMDACWAHKDNIYALVAMTRPSDMEASAMDE